MAGHTACTPRIHTASESPRLSLTQSPSHGPNRTRLRIRETSNTALYLHAWNDKVYNVYRAFAILTSDHRRATGRVCARVRHSVQYGLNAVDSHAQKAKTGPELYPFAYATSRDAESPFCDSTDFRHVAWWVHQYPQRGPTPTDRVQSLTASRPAHMILWVSTTCIGEIRTQMCLKYCSTANRRAPRQIRTGLLHEKQHHGTYVPWHIRMEPRGAPST